MQRCHWQHYQHHIVLVLVPMMLYDQKHDVEHHYDHLDLRNEIAPLMVDGAGHTIWCWYQCSGITWHQQQCQWHHLMLILISVASHNKESLVAPHFSCLDLRNTVVILMLLLAWCDTDVSANGMKWPKSYVAPNLNCLDLRNVMLPFWYSGYCDGNNRISVAYNFHYLD